MSHLRRTFRIDAKANLSAGCKSFILILFQLGEGVENNMVTNGNNFVDLIFTVSGGKDMILFAHFLMAQPCLE